MTHVDPAHLVELALRNGMSSDDFIALRHLATCVCCHEELNRMTRVVTAARSAEASDLPTAPPDRIWQRITQELSQSEEAVSSPTLDAVRKLHSITVEKRRTGYFMADIQTHHLALGLLAGAAVIWLSLRAKSH